MQPDASPDVAAAIESGCAHARQLDRLLEEEFSALSAQDLDAFEALQSAKEETLAHLTTLVQALSGRADEGTMLDEPASAGWGEFRSLMGRCREAHRRNDILIRSRLLTINAALRVLARPEEHDGVEVYDRLGKMSGRLRARGYSEA